MRKQITKFLGVFAVVGAVALAGCGDNVPTAEKKDRATVAAQQHQYAIGQPVPQYDYSLEREAAIQLYNARNTNVATHTVWRSFGRITFDCPSIGYPLPYDVSLTNPLKVERYTGSYGVAMGVIEQAEPNGLYSSKNSYATWVRCVTDEGIAPVYVEDDVSVFPFPMEVDYANHRVTKAGKATITIMSKDPLAESPEQVVK